MNFQAVVDSVLGSTKQRLTNESKADAFVVLFNNLKTNGFLSKDVSEEEISYIINKLDIEMSHKVGTKLQRQLYLLDIKHIADLILEEVKSEIVKPVFTNTEQDVLDEEEIMEQNPNRKPIVIDHEYLKFLGDMDE